MPVFSKHPALPQDWCSPFGQALHKGGSAPSYPGPSAEERELQSTQTAILKENQAMVKEQMRQQELLAPLLYKNAGLTPRYENGQLVGFDEIPESADPNAVLRKEIEGKLLERSMAALNGELPVDIGLMRDLDEADTKLNDVLFKNLGSGYATSSPGIEAQSKNALNRTRVLDAARRDDLTMAEGLSLNRSNQISDLNTKRISQLVGTTNIRDNGIGQLGNIAQLFGQQAQGYAQERGRKYQADFQAYQQNQKPGIFQSILGIAAGAAGAKFGGAAGSGIWSIIGGK